MRTLYRSISRKWWGAWGLTILLLVCAVLIGCSVGEPMGWRPVRPPPGAEERTLVLLTTGYCPCGECCNWQRNWWGRPVVAAGQNEGKPKAVGVTATGTSARPGTLAADPSVFPYGTIMYIPNYGYGRVEDTGSAIKGNHIDLFFRTHSQAEEWGSQAKKVKVWVVGSTPAANGGRQVR